MTAITRLSVYDIRFPTSVELDGSDAMNPDPDYSAPYVIVSTDAADGLEGHAFTFTIGRGNDVEVALPDFRYISDAITPAEALTLFRATTPGRDNRCATLLVVAFLHTQLALSMFDFVAVSGGMGPHDRVRGPSS